MTAVLLFTSCSASYMLHKKGMHKDTVEIWIKAKTNNAIY
nr:MAG TPA: Lysis protein [Microviridae sp.]